MSEFNDHGDESIYEALGGMRALSSADPFRDSPLNSRATRDDLALCTGDFDGISEAGSGHRSHRNFYRRFSEERSNYDDFVATDKKILLKTLIAAESAANSAAIQLVSFRDILEDDFTDSRCSSDHQLSRQKNMLLEKLEVFKRINKSVRQQLKELQDEEVCRLETDQHIDVLLKKLTQTEIENQHLKSNLSDKERRVEELMALRKKEMENTESVVQLSRSVDSTRAHLQGQLRSKEGENNRLAVQLRGLERTLTEQKLEMDDLRGQVASASEKAAQEKGALKKAARAQKHRAEKFEAAVEKCYDQLRGKDLQLAETRAEKDVWRTQQEQRTEEKVQLEAEIAVLKEELADMSAVLQRERDTASAASEVLLQEVEKLNAEKEELSLENATLQVSIAGLEDKLVHALTVFQEQSALSQERKYQVEQYQTQVAELQTEVSDLRNKLESLLKETEDAREGREVEVAKARQQLEGRVQELERCPELLSAAEKSLLDCQDDLCRSQRRCTDKSESLRQLQFKVDRQMEKLKSSLDMKESINEANSQLQAEAASLQKRMEEVQLENQELVHRLAGQEETLHYSGRQLDQRSAECQALNRQLEAALADVKQQVSKVKEKSTSRESSLQAKVLELETERSRRENEFKQLKLSKLSSEKQYEVRLKDLQLSLDQSESHKQSIQNYVDFLKNSYAAMFEEGLPRQNFGSSYFFK